MATRRSSTPRANRFGEKETRAYDPPPSAPAARKHAKASADHCGEEKQLHTKNPAIASAVR